MSAASRLLALSAALLVTPAVLSAQASSPSPTLPSDTLQANFAPRSASGPTPELAPTLPSDTLKATQPVDWGDTVMPRDEAAPEETPAEERPNAGSPS
jgi:hypothetical protein